MPRFDSDSFFILRSRSESRAVWEAASPSWRGTAWAQILLFPSACFRKGFYMWPTSACRTASLTPIYTGTNVRQSVLIVDYKLCVRANKPFKILTKDAQHCVHTKMQLNMSKHNAVFSIMCQENLCQMFLIGFSHLSNTCRSRKKAHVS